MSSGSPKLSEEHLDYLQGRLREIVAEQAYSADDIDDAEIDDEWIDWIETYEEAIDALSRLGVDPYDDPLEWMEFLDPLGEFEPEETAGDDLRFRNYLAKTYGVVRI